MVTLKEPRDMEAKIGSSRARQWLPAFDDQVSLDSRNNAQNFDCGPLVYNIVDANNERPKFIHLNEQASELRLIASSVKPEDVGEH